MSRTIITPSGQEACFAENDIIVSKTDLRGIITYANEVFVQVSGYSEHELLGQPHNIIRHPEMPGCVFKLLWDTLREGREIFAYVLNMCKNGDHYWVFAHVTPSFDESGRILGYHSNRRVPHQDALRAVRPLYAQLLAEEERHQNRVEAVAASTQMLHALLKSRGQDYDEFVFSLSAHTRLGAKD